MLESPIRPAMRSPLQQALDRIGSAAIWTPATLFAASEQGVWYDPSDLSTLFRDAAGAVPVTATGQGVGLMLDKSKGLVLGSELVTNGDGSSVTGWGNFNANSSLSSVSGSLRVTVNSGTSGYATQTITTVAGKTYAVTFTIVGATKSTSRFLVGTSSGSANLYSGVNLPLGANTAVFTATTASSYLTIGMDSVVAGDYIDFDNISVKELPGNHATQATAAARPVLATGADLDGVDDSMAQSAGGGSTTAFMLCAAVKPEGGAASARTIWSDAGTNTGYIVRLNASNQLEMSVGNGTAYTTIATTATVDVGTAYVVTAWDDGTNLNVQVNNGAVASVARPTVSAGTATATLGKNNGAATGFFNGQLISIIQVNNDGGTASERTAAKAYAAGKGGVTL